MMKYQRFECFTLWPSCIFLYLIDFANPHVLTEVTIISLSSSYNIVKRASFSDPTAMSRIVDITDLVDDSDDDDDDNIIGSSSSMPHTMHIGTAGSKRSSSSSSKKGLVGLIILAAIVCVVGFGYVNNQRSSSSTVSSAYLLVDDEDGQQEKLETAERVITACGQDNGGINKECQTLCKSKLCCFETDDYGCQADDSKDCATYAGCIALVEGVADLE